MKRRTVGILGLSIAALNNIPLEQAIASNQEIVACKGKAYQSGWGGTVRHLLKIRIGKDQLFADIYHQRKTWFGWGVDQIMGPEADKMRIKFLAEDQTSISYTIWGASSEDSSVEKNYAILTIMKSNSSQKIVKIVDYNNALGLNGSYTSAAQKYELTCDVEY